MSRTMPVDTQWQNFWKESIETETGTRMRWALKFDTEFQRMLRDPNLAQFPVPDDRFDVVKEVTIQHPKCSYVVDKRYHNKKNPGPPPIPEIPPSGCSLDMYQPDGCTKALLYQGISHHGEGRLQYLRARSKLYPDDRYPHQRCTNWDYGWGIQGRRLSKSKFATVAVCNSEFFRPNHLHWVRDQAKKEGRFSNRLEKE